VSAVGDALGDALTGDFGAGEGEVDEFDSPALGAQTADEFEVASSGKSGFKGEVFLLLDAGFDFSEEEAAGGEELAIGG
jgi:hypothetical protein